MRSASWKWKYLCNVQGSGGTSVVWVWASMLYQVCVLQQRLATPISSAVPKLSCSCDTNSSMDQNDFPANLYHIAIWSLEISSVRQAQQPHTGRGPWRCSGQRPKLTYCLEDGERKTGDKNSPDHESNWKSDPKDCPNVSHSSFSTQTVISDCIFGYFSFFFFHLANSCWQYLLRGFSQLYLTFHVLLQTCHQQIRNGYLPTDTQEDQDSKHMWYRIDEVIISLQQYRVS